MLRIACLVVLWTWCGAALAWADDPPRLSQYAHSVWRVQDGAFASGPTAITQTIDGYIWIGTTTGLIRFDGVRLSAWPTTAQTSPHPTAVFSLHGAADGTLWIGGGSSLWSLRDGRLQSYAEGRGRISKIVVDDHNAVWFTRTRPADRTGPLCQIANGKGRCYEMGTGISAPAASALVAGTSDSWWIGNSRGVINWTPAASRAYALPDLDASGGLSGVSALATAADGSVWAGISRRGPGLGLQRVTPAGLTPIDIGGLQGESLVVTSLFLDRDKTMWIGTQDAGIYRVVKGRVDRFQKADGLSGDSVSTFFEDREGNIWVATSDGLDCFRKTRTISFSTKEGLKANQAASVVASRDGNVWIGNQGSLDLLAGSEIKSIERKDGLPGNDVTALLIDGIGRLWVGVDNGLAVYEQGAFRAITLESGKPTGPILTMAEDRAGNIWAEVLGNPRRLLRITDSRVREDMAAPRIPPAASLAADPDDGIWMGLDSGDLGRYRNDALETIPLPSNGKGAVRQVAAIGDGAVLALTSNGIVGWRNGARPLTVENNLPCTGAYSFAVDQRGALWIYAPCGLLEIAAAELRRWWTDADAKLQVRQFDAQDGVRPAPASFEPHAAQSPDGRLWFVNDSIVQVIDPANPGANTLAPPVHIEQMVADRHTYDVTSTVTLPPLSKDVEISFTALSFVAPQKVMFRYRLDGRDRDWQESGTRRQAFYSDLPPGNYRFHVIAANNEGVWNEQGDALDIVVLPAWYQTRLFLVAVTMLGIAIVWTSYQLRVRQVARALSSRFDERLAERTRVARDLHDTLLQTVQGSKMVVDDALNRAPDTADMRTALEKVSTWLGQATTEGRAAVDTLRTSAIETNDLAAAFQRAIEDCQRHGTTHPTVAVHGSHREMHPLVRDEVYRFGYEAIRNACTHSAATRVDVEINYARDLVLRVADDGVGIDAVILDTGKAGHFGLQGMRERAERIGAKLQIASSPGAGTTITLTVPGRAIFKDSEGGLVSRIRRRLTSAS